jgi:hypothetical protein
MQQKDGFNIVQNCNIYIYYLYRYLPLANAILLNKTITIISARSVYGE